MFDKISLEKISFHTEGNNIVFSTTISDAKQILLAAGRIHQHSTHGTGVWDLLSNSVLTLTLPLQPSDKSLNKIKEAFNGMVS